MEPQTSEFRAFGPIGRVFDGRELVGLVDGTDDDAVDAMFRAIQRSIEAHHVGPDGADPAFWGPRLSHVAPDLVVTAGVTDEAADVRASRWLEAEVTHVLACEGGAMAGLLEEVGIDCVEMGSPGATGPDAGWWEQGLAFARAAQPGKLVVSCSTGISLSPTLAFRILLDRGVPFEEAFVAIGAARPIVRMTYAREALAHHAETVGWAETRSRKAAQRVAELLDVDPVQMWVAANLPGESSVL